MDVDLREVDTILDKYSQEQRGLIPSLLEIQRAYNYLPPEALVRVAERMRVSQIQVYQVASFYKAFSLEPRGKHIVTVCMGTACHVRGSERLVDQVTRVIGIHPGETSKDNQFTLEVVSCLGTCALGPVMVVDGKYYGNMTASKVERVFKKYMEKEEVVADVEN